MQVVLEPPTWFAKFATKLNVIPVILILTLVIYAMIIIISMILMDAHKAHSYIAKNMARTINAFNVITITNSTYSRPVVFLLKL